MNVAFLVLLPLGGFALVAWIAKVQGRKTRENLRSLTAKLGLALADAKPALGIFWPAPRAPGVLDGRTAELYTFTKGAGKSRTYWCALRVELPRAGGVEFNLAPEGMGRRLLGLFGVKEVTVGDRAFDDAFFVRTNRPELLVAALVPDIQARMLAAQHEGVRGTFKLEHGELTYVEQGSFSSAKVCRHFERAWEVLRDLAVAAEVMTGP